MNKYIRRPLFVLLTLLLVSCVSEMEGPTAGEGGRLRLSLANISTATTRTTPTDLGKPLASDFRLTITNGSGRTVYDDVFTEDELTLPVGEYGVKVTHGTDALLAVDAPYYVGETSVEIKENETAEASITATVGNALVSVNFGRDADELARFNRFYSDYSVQVGIGGYSMRITKDEPAKSIYVRAGSRPALRFWGKLKFEDDREVSMELTSDDLPQALAVADHLILTLGLPDPESALGVDISKVEVETIMMDETIPLSWLPVAVTVPQHQYDKDGTLVGTNLLITDAYPGLKWRAVITNQAGTTVRSVEGTGALESHYNSAANASTWPYLPQGQYKASYYIIGDDNTATFQSSRDFTVPAPNISVSVSGYTSYDKYLAGDIDGANACDRLTIYEPCVRLSVANTLLKNTNYSYAFTYTYDGQTTNVSAGSNTYAPGNMTGQAVQIATHVLLGNATFDGVSASARQEFRITGLPYSLDLKNHGEWVSSSGVDWYENDVRLGHLSTGSQSITTSTSICLPMGTYFCADYSVNVHTLTVGTTFTMNVGSLEILRIEEAGTPFNDKDHLYSGTTDTRHDDNQYLTTITCHNSYGAGQTCSHIYSLTFKYASH